MAAEDYNMLKMKKDVNFFQLALLLNNKSFMHTNLKFKRNLGENSLKAPVGDPYKLP